ncbi:MAG: GGDEF domain-containing protein [Oscillospiraceae bacterium]|nr:GGDEF domain-containing protein [Oscillospiraceae bacterium]
MAMNENTLAEELRAMREEMRAMREQMSEMIGDTNKKLEVIGSFVAAINESQTFEKTMHAVENVTKDVTGCDKADFIAEDNGKFFSTDGEVRTYIQPENADEIKKVMETGRISVRGDAAIIPVQSGNDSSVGVIIAEKIGGFDSAELAQLESGSTVMNTVKLAVEKEMNHRMAVTDELTSLKNRDGLNEYLKNTLCDVIDEKKPVSILMCDIDHFKSVNDTYGHDAGDVVLRGVADIISENTRGGYDSAFRMGGEEMACVLCCDVNEATKIAERIRTEVENASFYYNGQDIGVTLSIGVHQMDAKEIVPENARIVFDAELKYADNAVYEAKESGRNQVIISAESAPMADRSDVQQPESNIADEQDILDKDNLLDRSNISPEMPKNDHFKETIGKMSDWADKVIEKAEQLKAIEQEQNKDGAAR